MEAILQEKERRAKAVRDLEEWRKQASESMTPEAAALTDEEINRIVHEVRAEQNAR